MIALLVVLALQEEVTDIIRRLSDDSIEVRSNAADALVGRGRRAIPLVRQTMERAGGEVNAVAAKCIERIDRAEVHALLDKAGHKELDDAVVVTAAVFAKLLPRATMRLLPTTPACGA